MAACEKCWEDAYLRSQSCPSKSQTEHYMDLLREREAEGHICSPKAQAGRWWDEETQTDTRITKTLSG